MATDFLADAETRYLEAVGRRDAIRDAWEKDGAPLLATGSTGQLVEHPYVRMLRDHDLLVDRLGQHVRPARLGRPPSSAPGLPPPLEERPVRRVK